MLTNILYILLAIVMLGIIVIIHELGHFLLGRLCGIGVLEFSVGMGPKLFGWRRGGTDYSLRALPIGGFCKFEGEDEDNHSSTAINNQPVWKRILTVAAGPAMNFLLAYVAAAIILMSFGMMSGLLPLVASVGEGMPAAAALQPGDIVTQVGGEDISYDTQGVEMLRAAIQSSDAVTLTVNRDGENVQVELSPATVETESGPVKQIGVTFTAEIHRDTLLEAIPDAGRAMANTIGQMLTFLRNLIFRGEGAGDVAGAVGTVAVVSQQLQADSSLFLDFLYVISLNLGIMNLLPLPALDGGRLVFLFVEAIRRKPVPPEKEGMVHAIGLMAFFLLFIVLTWHDITTFIFH